MESTSIFYHPEEVPKTKVEVDKCNDSYCLSIESTSTSKAITINLFFSSIKEITELENNIHNAIAKHVCEEE